MNVSTTCPTIGVDLGKTRCRVRVAVDDRVFDGDGAGLAGLASGTSPAAVLARVTEVLAGLQPAAAPDSLRGARVGIGAAGALSAPDAAAQLARLAADRFVGSAAVASDVVAAHIGAFDGGEGVCLIVGTGAVALGAAGGEHSWRDGRGLATGDVGSGAWLGREGLRAAELAAAGAGPATTLVEQARDARAVLGEASTRPDGAFVLASFAPAVLASAHAGDEVAAAIVKRAVAELTATARAAANDVGCDRVAVCGGVSGDEGFRAQLSAQLAASGLTPVPAAGDALDGALVMADGAQTALEGGIHRA